MKKAILAFAALLWAAAAHAGCTTGSYPFILQDNTTADATQVMADFNQVTTGVLANCAGSGTNNDITSLNALSTPIQPVQGGSNLFSGSTTAGSANGQLLTVASNFTLSAGYRVAGIVGTGLANTGPTTLQVNATTPANFDRKTQLGVQPMAGGELIPGNPFIAVYDGTEFILEGEVQIVGHFLDWSTAAAPPGYFIADGSSFSCATYQTLCALLGTAYGGTAANPALPDTRGRMMTGLDNYGTSTGAAGRLTSAATGCGTAFTLLGVTCANGSQSHSQIVAELASHNHGVNDPGHIHNELAGGANNLGAGFIAQATNAGAGGTSNNTAPATTGISIQFTGSGQPMPIVNPNFGVVKIIKF